VPLPTAPNGCSSGPRRSGLSKSGCEVMMCGWAQYPISSRTTTLTYIEVQLWTDDPIRAYLA